MLLSFPAIGLRLSLPVQGAWVEIGSRDRLNVQTVRSLPVQGAWVEMSRRACGLPCHAGRSPCGERGLKYHAYIGVSHFVGRSPCGERGLKYVSTLHFLGGLYGRSPCGSVG